MSVAVILLIIWWCKKKNDLFIHWNRWQLVSKWFVCLTWETEVLHKSQSFLIILQFNIFVVFEHIANKNNMLHRHLFLQCFAEVFTSLWLFTVCDFTTTVLMYFVGILPDRPTQRWTENEVKGTLYRISNSIQTKSSMNMKLNIYHIYSGSWSYCRDYNQKSLRLCINQLCTGRD